MTDTKQAKRLSQCGAELVMLKPDRFGKLNLKTLLKRLVTDHQMTNILVEGGATLHGQMFKQKLVDQVLAYVTPKLLGDPTALSPVNTGKQLKTITQGMALTLRDRVAFGDDTLLDFRVNR
jgi:diaminohydroxyphosphoribosylaminopyrimidine deaminase/5-amino-6-(5-phosphoribosylamino)uracil reductase